MKDGEAKLLKKVDRLFAQKKKIMEKLCKLKGVDPGSGAVSDISDVSECEEPTSAKIDQALK